MTVLDAPAGIVLPYESKDRIPVTLFFLYTSRCFPLSSLCPCPPSPLEGGNDAAMHAGATSFHTLRRQRISLDACCQTRSGRPCMECKLFARCTHERGLGGAAVYTTTQQPSLARQPCHRYPAPKGKDLDSKHDAVGACQPAGGLLSARRPGAGDPDWHPSMANLGSALHW